MSSQDRDNLTSVQKFCPISVIFFFATEAACATTAAKILSVIKLTCKICNDVWPKTLNHSCKNRLLREA